MDRIYALQAIRVHALDVEAVKAEEKAMWADRDLWNDLKRKRSEEFVDVDREAMVWCPLRDVSVIGVETHRLPRAHRPCYLCGKPLPPRRTSWCSNACADRWAANHQWSWASETALRRDGRACVRCGSKAACEVNHIVPLVGRGYHNSCRNHLDGLETLCHVCHVAETTRQRRERAGIGTA